MNYNTISKDSTGFTNKIISILKNIGISFGITFILLALFAFIINYTDFPSSAVSPITVLITMLSIILSGILNGKKAVEKGWLTGLISGVLYMILLYLAGSIMFRDFTLNANAILMILGGMFSGIIGGIIGINNKKYRR